MSVLSLQDATIWVGGTDLTSDTNEVDVDVEIAELDKTTFGSGGDRELHPGLWQKMLMHRGFLNFDAAASSQVLASAGIANQVVSLSPTGGDGDHAFMLRGMLAKYKMGAKVGDLTALEGTLSGSGPERIVDGTIILPKTTAASSDTGEAHELVDVDSDQRLYAALHVFAASGTSPTLDVIIESDDSADFDGSESTRITFDQADGVGAQWKTADGPIADDFWRVDFTIGGTDPSFTFAVVLGIADLPT